MSEDKPKSPLFSNLCALMQRIADQRGTEPKKRRLDKYIYEWRKEYGQDFYEAFRLLLPHVRTISRVHIGNIAFLTLISM